MYDTGHLADPDELVDRVRSVAAAEGRSLNDYLTRVLRAADAVQLAGACATADVEPDCTTFAAFDKELRSAAAAEGFAVVPA